MSATATGLLKIIWQSLGATSDVSSVAFTGSGDLASYYPVTDLACAAVGATGLALAELIGFVSATIPTVTVDRRLSSFWFSRSIRPLGWTMPEAWDPIAGDYKTRDGWIRLHTNAPHHRRAAEHILGSQPDRAAMARAVSAWTKNALETAIVEAGGCAAEMRSVADWVHHPQGEAVALEPLVHMAASGLSSQRTWTPTPTRPLAGLRVLDLTRVLAGPVATRVLAGYGADVVRIDPPHWDEPAIVPDVTIGKRCARLDLHIPEDRACFERLLEKSDIIVHGYRPGALEGLGYGPEQRQIFSPGLIDVSLCAYGWSGPWAKRRGFDSLVQMSTGIADMGMTWRHADKPVPLPVQALDHATGYLIAATALRALARRLETKRGSFARLSLARTATFLIDAPCSENSLPIAPDTPSDCSLTLEPTAWGPARRLLPPLTVDGTAMMWTHPARPLGSAPAAWH